jgi:hypothetical protein
MYLRKRFNSTLSEERGGRTQGSRTAGVTNERLSVLRFAAKG